MVDSMNDSRQKWIYADEVYILFFGFLDPISADMSATHASWETGKTTTLF